MQLQLLHGNLRKRFIVFVLIKPRLIQPYNYHAKRPEKHLATFSTLVKGLSTPLCCVGYYGTGPWTSFVFQVHYVPSFVLTEPIDWLVADFPIANFS